MNQKSFLLKFLKLGQLKTNEHTVMAILSVIVGLAAGLGAVGFRYLINFFQTLAYGSPSELLDVVKTIPWSYKVGIPAAGGLIVGPLVYFFAREAKGHGVPEVMEAVALRGGVIRKRVVFVKTMASAISIGTGGSVGREGPIVQIGSAIGSTAVSRAFLGDTPAFIVPVYQLVSAWEFPIYLILGLFCAAVGVTFTKTLYRFEDLFDSLKFPEYLKPVIGGAILGVSGLFIPQILGVGYGAMDLALGQQLAWWLMLLLVAAKLLATSITIGSGGSGGVFAPSLYLGVMAGGFFGMVVHHLFPNVTASPGAYSIVGMGAVVSATTHGPLAAILILFEMTGSYEIILPLMFSCIIATIAAGQLMKESIYTLKLVRRGVDIREGKEVNVLKSMQVKDVMSPDVETVSENWSLERMSDKISKSKYNSFPVLNSENELAGIISFNDYSDAIFDEDLKNIVVAKDLASSDVVTVSSSDNLYTALEKITRNDFSTLPVVSPNDPAQLIGIVTRRDVIGAYEKAVLKKSLFQN